jgi:hypothetical protein
LTGLYPYTEPYIFGKIKLLNAQLPNLSHESNLMSGGKRILQNSYIKELFQIPLTVIDQLNRNYLVLDYKEHFKVMLNLLRYYHLEPC